MSVGVVTGLFVASGYGSPLDSLAKVLAIEGVGLQGDRYAGTRRQVTLIAEGELRHAAADLGVERIDPAATRRNIAVDVPALPRVHGSPIFVGPVELAVWRDCAPCSVMDDTIGRGAQHALRSRGGVSAQVVSGGSIRLGDAVHF